jgi:hypothetical protein
MKKKFSLKRSDLLIALTATALSASFLACGPGGSKATPTGAIPGATTQVPANVVPPTNPQQLNDLSKFPAAEVAAMTGTFDAQQIVEDDQGNRVYKPASIVITPSAMNGQAGRYFSITFSNGTQVLSAYAQTTKLSTYNGFAHYGIFTYPTPVKSISEYSPVSLYLELSINGNNLLDPTSSTVRLGTVNGVFFQDVLEFEYGLQKR